MEYIGLETWRGRTDRQTDRQADKQTERQTCRRTCSTHEWRN